MSVEVEHLSVSYGSHKVLSNVSFFASPGDCLAVLGPNGVGKSTLFRCILGFLKAQNGRVLIGGKPIDSVSRAEMARLIAYIPQSAFPAFNYTVLDTVLMGTTNRLSTFQGPKDEDVDRAMEILEELGISHLWDRGCGKISGGERQLALLARALIQDARVLIMDEPTANLDYGNRFRVMERIGALRKGGYTIIFSTHEPNQAFQYATKVLALKDGAILTLGEPEAVLTEETLAALYGIGVHVGTMEVGGTSRRVSIPYQVDRKGL